MADADRLVQVFENLLQNSADHGGADVTVRVGPLEDGFYVEDDGPGVPEADRERVFEHGYTTREDGMGYGLSIVRSVVGAHGWDIRVTGSGTGGARFEITGIDFVSE
jgi:signal transduction histidine kinase